MKQEKALFRLLLAVVVASVVLATAGWAQAWSLKGFPVTNNTGKTGRVYLSVQDQWGNPLAGTSSFGMYSTAASTPALRGIPTGSAYTTRAFIDTRGTGFQHANDPSFSYGPYPVNGDLVQPIAFSQPAPVAAVAPGRPKVTPLDGAAIVDFEAPRTQDNLPIADSYNIYWSTDANPGPGNTVGGGQLLNITTREPKIVVYNLTNGSTLYFAVSAVNSVGSAISQASDPVLINPTPGPGASTVQLTVDTSGIGKTSQTPLLVALSDEAGKRLYGSYLKNPGDLQNVQIAGIPAGTYKIYAILDLDGKGNLDAAANVSNISENDRLQRGIPIMVDGVSATVAGPTLKLSRRGAGVAVRTGHSRQYGYGSTGLSDNYSLSFRVSQADRPLTNVTLNGGPQVTGPIDMALSPYHGSAGEFELQQQVGKRPQVGDSYQLTLGYADGSSEQRSAAVTGVLDAFATPLYPVQQTGPDSVAPLFAWNNPGNLTGFCTTGVNSNGFNAEFLQMSALGAPFQGTPFPVGMSSQWSQNLQDLDGNSSYTWNSFTPNANGPRITGFTPQGGAAGSTLTILGSGFDANPANNQVAIGGMTATVTAATSSSLTVTAPASSGIVTVTVNGVSAGSSAPFAATAPYGVTVTDGADGTSPLSGAAMALLQNPTLSTVSGTSGDATLQVPARPYFSLGFSLSGYLPTHSALTSVTGPVSTSFNLFTAATLQARGAAPSSGKGVIVSRVQDASSNATTLQNVAGAVVTATSALHPDAPYAVKYTNGGNNVALDPALASQTASDGRFFVADVDEGDIVTVSASKAGMWFPSRVFLTHAGTVFSGNLKGALASTASASPKGGSYTAAQTVTLAATDNDNIFYTLDGSDPSLAGTLYSAPFTVNPNTTLKFVARNKYVAGAVGAVQTELYGSPSANQAATAFGSYSFDSGNNLLTLNWTSSNFPCSGPSPGTETQNVTSLTETSMTWSGKAASFTRPGGTGIAGNWSYTDSSSPAPYQLYLTSDGKASYTGNPSCGSPSGDTQPPTVPTGVMANLSAANQVNLSWAPASDNVGVARYQIFRNGTLIGQPTGSGNTYWQDGAVTAGASYSYSVSACDGANNCSAASAPVQISVPGTGGNGPAPATPTGLYAMPQGTSQAYLSWNYPADGALVAGYRVYRFDQLVGQPAGANTWWNDGGLTPGATYSYSVSACDANNNCSAPSQPVQVTLPAAPKPRVLPLDGAAFVILDQNSTASSVAPTSYDIYWSTTPNPGPNNTTGGGQLLGIPTRKPKVVVYNLTNGSTLYFAVAWSYAGTSPGTAAGSIAYSDPVTINAPQSAASTVRVTVDSTGIAKNNPWTPLLVALSDDSGKGLYASYVKAPSDLQTVEIPGVAAGTYKIYTVLDLDGKGNVDALANPSNTVELDRNQRAVPITVDGVSATVNGPTLKLAVKNAAVAVTTSHASGASYRNSGASTGSATTGVIQDSYNLVFQAARMNKELTGASVESGPQLAGPVSLYTSYDSDSPGQYRMQMQANQRPKVGDSYRFTLNYADGSTETRTAAVTGVLDSFTTPLYPVQQVGPDSLAPTFSWANPGNIPGFLTTNLHLNGFNADFLPLSVLSVPYQGYQLSGGMQWQQSVRDLDGNEAVNFAQFTPSASGPRISGFSPKGGAAGSTVTITGSGFDTTPANNKVSFGGMPAQVLSASADTLTVSAPASSGVITVGVAGTSAGSKESFAATVPFTANLTDGADGTSALGAASFALAENPQASTSTGTSGAYTLNVPARPYFSMVFSQQGYYPTYSALLTVSGAATSNFSLYNQASLAARGITLAAGKGVIMSRVQDGSSNASTPPNLAGAVVTATSLLHPDQPYLVKYTNGSTNAAQDPASYGQTAADGRYFVVDVDEGDYVTVTARKAGMWFQNRVFATHGGAVSAGAIKGYALTSATANPPSGVYSSTVSVTLSATANDLIYYTTDGSDPLLNGSLYTAPISVTPTTLVRFVARNQYQGLAAGPVQSAVYSAGAQSGTASGSYSFEPSSGQLVLNWTASTFSCSGPKLGQEVQTVTSITSTGMTWLDGSMSFSRSAGTPGSLPGTWNIVDKWTNSYTATFNGDGTVQVTGTVYVCDGGNTGGTTADTQPPNVPYNLNVNPAGTGQVKFSWNPSYDNVGVTLYNVFRNGTPVAQVPASANSYWLDSNVAANTSYGYSVNACDAAGNCSAQSPTIQATSFGSAGQAGSASGSYSFNPITGNLTWNWTAVNFVCDGPKPGSEVKTVSSLTATSMTWSSDSTMTWTRPSGTAGDLVGSWNGVDSSTGNSFLLTFDANGTMSGTGTIYFCASASTSGGGTAGTQSISFAVPTSMMYGDGPLTLNATASSGLPVSYSILSGPAALSGKQLTVTGTGTIEIKASQAGSASYSPAPDVYRSITVGKGKQSIGQIALNPAKLNFGSSSVLAAQASSSLPVSFTSLTPGVCSVSGSTVTGLKVGSCTLAADQPGDASYLAALQTTLNLPVNALLPDAPASAQALAGNGQALVSFPAPANTGGAPITLYTVTAQPGGITGKGAASPVTVSGLANGTSYSFTVTASNQAGAGLPSPASNPVTPASEPAPPTALQAVAGSHSATVSFNPPFSNGGSSIVKYLVTATPGGLTATGSQSPITVTGLANGTSYTFAAQAVNAVGVSALSAPSNAVKPLSVPGAPTGVGAVGNNASATVRFLAPEANGSPITGYTVTSNPGNLSATGLASPISVTGLQNGVAYSFTVTAANAAGTGPASTPSASVTPSADVPGAPAITGVSAGNASATVSFAAPASNGGSAIVSYTVTSTPGNLSATGAASPLTVTGLTNGTAYSFTVTASNAAGTGVLSAPSASVTPATVPEAATGVSAKAGNGSATVNFTAPANNGGSPVTGYLVTASPGDLVKEGTASPIVVSGLSNGTAYSFTVTARNVKGAGPVSASSNTVTPDVMPGAPSAVAAQGGNASATVSFAPPAANGGSAIVSYTVTSTPGNLTATGAASPVTVTGLANGTAYSFTVTAVNASRSGAPSAPSNSVTPATVPGAPLSVAAASGNASATVRFAAPAEAGGSPVTGYLVTVTPGGNTVSGATSPIFVGGLANGTSYSFTVQAVNAKGSGAASAASNSVTPQANVPGAPSIGVASAGAGQATVAFTAPANDGGSPITGYTVTSSPGGFSATGSASPITVTGLANGVRYTFTVSAANGSGSGAASGASNGVVPDLVPDAPTIGSASADFGKATVSFSAPQPNGGTPVLGYLVTATPGGQSATGTASPISIGGLVNGTGYSFTVRAINAKGQGEPSAASNQVVPSDNRAPVVYLLGIPAAVHAPDSAGTVNVPVGAILAWDNVGVTGYLVTGTASKPAAGAGGWSANIPAGYDIPSAPGIYTLYAWAKDAAGNVSDPASAQVITIPVDTTPPVIISGPTVTLIRDSFAVVEWQTNESASGRLNFGESFPLSHALNENGYGINHSITLTGLTADTTYYVNVSSTDLSGNGPTPGRGISFRTSPAPDTTPPLVTEGPSVIGIGPDSATVQWRTNEPAQGNVFYGTTNLLGELSPEGGLATVHTLKLTGLAAQTQYYVKVSASDALGNGPRESALVSFKTAAAPDLTPPVVVEGPMVVNLSDTGATVIWKTNEPATSEVTTDTAGSNFALVADSTLTTSHAVSLTGLTATTPYNYRIASTDGFGNTVRQANPKTFSTLAAPDLTPPVILEGPMALNITEKSALITWGTDEPADSVVEYGVAGNLDQVASRTALVRGHSIALTGLAAGTVYGYRVSSTDSFGNGPTVSRTGSFTTNAYTVYKQPVITKAPSVIYRTDTTLTLYWETDEPCDSVVQYGENDTLTDRVANPEPVTRHQVTITNLKLNTNYKVVVSSTNASGNTVTADSARRRSYYALNLVGILSGALAGAPAADFTTLSQADLTPPVIAAGPTVTGISDTQAVISWSTDEIADSQVSYGTSGGALGFSAGSIEQTTTHVIVLTNLTPNTAYDFQVGSTDPSNNGPTLSPAHGVLSFTTAATPDLTAPVIGAITTPVLGASQVTVEWATDEPATTQVKYGLAADAMTAQAAGTGLSTDHSLTLALKSGTTYYLSVLAADAAGNVRESAPISFTMLGEADVTEPNTTPSLGSGSYTGVQNVTLSADKPADIYYTTDGSEPSTASPVYNGPIRVATSKRLAYFAIDGSGNQEVAKTTNLLIQYPIATATPDGNGSLSCPALANSGESAVCSATPSTGYRTAAVSGCGAGNLVGDSYSTGLITADCTVTATFNILSYAVTPATGTGWDIVPATAQSVNHGATASFTVTAQPGYGIVGVSGCGGTLTGGSFTTGAVTGPCSVSVSAQKHSGNSGNGPDPSIVDAMKALQAFKGALQLSAAEQIMYDVAPLAANGTPAGDGKVDGIDVIHILRRSIGIGTW